jgi:NADPH:quinone reductase
MEATYRAVMLTRAGGPEVLQCVELPVEHPGPGQLRVRVHAAGVGSTDLIMLAGKYPYAPKMPFVPGYEIAGVVEAIGAGVTGFEIGQRVAALTLYGGYGERLVREAENFLPIPGDVSDVEAAAVILNYVTAWQMIHRVAKVRPGQTALVTGAAGGVGTAALQLLQLAGVTSYGAASEKKHDIVRKLGATPIDYRAAPIDRLTRVLEPDGVDYVFDAIGGANIGLCIGAARRGGLVVGYGFMSVPGMLTTLIMFLNLFIVARLLGRRGTFFGITRLYRRICRKSSHWLPPGRSTPSSPLPCPCSRRGKRSSCWPQVRWKAKLSSRALDPARLHASILETAQRAVPGRFVESV